jgi:ATP-dependent RNA helicase DDX1
VVLEIIDDILLSVQPSRELAEQTLNQVRKFKKHLKDILIREVLLIGGMSAKDQIDQLMSGVEIVCGTPGRMDDLMSTGKLLLSNVRFFVLDEAVSFILNLPGIPTILLF